LRDVVGVVARQSLAVDGPASVSASESTLRAIAAALRRQNDSLSYAFSATLPASRMHLAKRCFLSTPAPLSNQRYHLRRKPSITVVIDGAGFVHAATTCMLVVWCYVHVLPGQQRK